MMVKVEGFDKKFKQGFLMIVEVYDNRVQKINQWLPKEIQGKTLDYLVNWCKEQNYKVDIITQIAPGKHIIRD